jgi:hypothetical protein
MNSPKNVIAVVRTLALLALAVAGPVSLAAAPVAIGPAEGVSATGSTLVVLGQRIRVDASARAQASLVRAGDMITVVGYLDSAGMPIATGVSPLESKFVPGSTIVYVRGSVRELKASVGSAQIGSLQVDYTAALVGEEALALRAGDIVEISGIYFGSALMSASLIAKYAITGTEACASGIAGTGRVETSSDGIAGTGRVETSSDGIAGTGRVETSSDGIAGTGRVETSSDGIAGTGRVETSSDGIAGTGRVKTSSDGIAGTGRVETSSDGIAGTGRVEASSDGIAGTGRFSGCDNGIAGTGR